METRLCTNCFAALPAGQGETCPVCGWDNSRAQIPEGLPCHTVLAGRYEIGRAKARNGEGITYAALDLATKKAVEVREFFPMSLALRDQDGLAVLGEAGQDT